MSNKTLVIHRERYRGQLSVGARNGNRIFVGWLASDPTSDLDFHIYTKNLTEYMSVEMSKIGFKTQSYSESKLTLLQQAEMCKMDFCLINQRGYWSSQINHEITNYLDNIYSNQSIIGDFKNLTGISLVNMKWWVQAGRPDPDSSDFCWFAKQHGASGWPEQLIKTVNLNPALDTHQQVLQNFKNTVLNTNVFFCANTEQINLNPERDIPTDEIITVAGGLGAILLAYSNQMPPGSGIRIIDTSPLAIAMSRRIIQEWDGEDYPAFVKMLMEQNPDQLVNFRGVRQLHIAARSLPKLSDFKNWFNTVFKTYDITYQQLDLMDFQQVQDLLTSIDVSRKRTVVINFSNVYHYVPSSFDYGYDIRNDLNNQTVRLISELAEQGDTQIEFLGCQPGDFYNVLRMFPWRKTKE
jgi:hypothetical protein